MRGWKPPDVGHRDHASFINSSRHGRLNIEKHAVCNTGIRTSTHSSRILFMFSGVRPSCQDARVRWQRGRLYIAGFSMGLPSVSQSELLPSRCRKRDTFRMRNRSWKTETERFGQDIPNHEPVRTRSFSPHSWTTGKPSLRQRRPGHVDVSRTACLL
jgi:hypothetical protein